MLPLTTILAFIVKYGALGGSRTHDLWLRKPTLYPAELRALDADYITHRDILFLVGAS